MRRNFITYFILFIFIVQRHVEIYQFLKKKSIIKAKTKTNFHFSSHLQAHRAKKKTQQNWQQSLKVPIYNLVIIVKLIEHVCSYKTGECHKYGKPKLLYTSW